MLPNDIPTHDFTATILEVLRGHFGTHAEEVFRASPLLQYLNTKTKSASRGSKSRGSFANHYALYVLTEDYVNRGFANDAASGPYSQYEGARFSDLLSRQRELPFGAKLQNHALNSRLNDEFKKFFPYLEKLPVVRDLESKRYWIQEDLLLVAIHDQSGTATLANVANAVIEIIDRYVEVKKESFERFLATCRRLSDLGSHGQQESSDFIIEQLDQKTDARVFEIVSYSVLKAKYGRESVWIGSSRDSVSEESLTLYKTGRTNANDGGIDFVMRPIGRFFQVTETFDLKKYFLDIDKVQRFPITFVVKSSEDHVVIREAIRQNALEIYGIEAVVNSYMGAVEEVITVPDLVAVFQNIVAEGRVGDVMEEIVAQSQVEFNYGQ